MRPGQDIVEAMERVEVANILRNSLPVAKNAAPPVPESLARDLASHRPPRFFRDTTSGAIWEYRNGEMTIEGEDSIFSLAEILCCSNVIEVDEYGDVIVIAAEDIAAEKSDRDRA